MRNFSEEYLRITLDASLSVLEQYKWLTDSYVLDFFVENHWERIPASWQNTFTSGHFHVKDMALLLNQDGDFCRKFSCVLPLSILTLKYLIQRLSISRKQEKIGNLHFPGLIGHPKFRNLFAKNVKIKKRHEIERMSAICSETAERCGVEYLVDVGGGLGHLSRVLAFGHGKKVCCVERQDSLNIQARVLDDQFLRFAKKYLQSEEYEALHSPTHLNLSISADLDAKSFVKHLKAEVFGVTDKGDFTLGIVGLHPCGDLGPILLNMFRECSEVKFIAVVGCCYMKLTGDGYPLSEHLRKVKVKRPERVILSYEAREVACHAMEMYEERLSQGLYDDLKIHAYRSALERIIVKKWPDLKHTGLKSVKYRDCSSFREYCRKAVAKLQLILPEAGPEEIKDCMEWEKVAIFYTFRLMLAPLVESVILTDRMLFLRENLPRTVTSSCDTVAVFDPRLSPRNHIVIATK
ncbi:methyltransferase-like protein 25B [Phlebotomus argentipes]|uniref:methyltransferase-like protein 25B n=1 Tax=Phlebotomus argentipes TaxID=94469 RepID=UPI0028933DC0|nr:methyltransferase-like protein 25B [Phlebotomus argentipes]